MLMNAHAVPEQSASVTDVVDVTTCILICVATFTAQEHVLLAASRRAMDRVSCSLADLELRGPGDNYRIWRRLDLHVSAHIPACNCSVLHHDCCLKLQNFRIILVVPPYLAFICIFFAEVAGTMQSNHISTCDMAS